MALSGNLKDFELPDIFQLIGQQRKTGILVLTDKNRTGSVVFNNGQVIAAESNTATPLSLLVNYLIYVHKYPESKIKEFLDFCKGSISSFANVTLKIQYISTEELYTIASMAVEDLACSLFLWKTGSYNFNPIDDISDYRIDTVTFSTDAITMEAMRRTDEMQRMREYIDDDEVVVPKDPDSKTLLASAPPTLFVADTRKYILHLLDGRKTINELLQNAFITRYRLYEGLFVLIQSGEVIAANQSDITLPGDINPFDTAENAITVATTVSALTTALIIILFFLMGLVLFPGFLLKKQEDDSFKAHNASAFINAEHNVTIGRILYNIENGTDPKNLGDLSSMRIISNADVARVVLARKSSAE